MDNWDVIGYLGLCSPQQLCPLCLQLADLSLLRLDLTPQSLQLLVETHTHTP